MKQYQIIITAILSFTIGAAILNGSVPSHYFAGPENELGCAVIALTMGTLSIFGIDWKSFINLLNK